MRTLLKRLTIRMQIALLLGGLLLLILTGFSFFLYFRLSNQLHQALDARLRTSADHWLALVEYEDGRVYFDQDDFSTSSSGEQVDVIRLVSPLGQVLDERGDDHPPVLPEMLRRGLTTVDYTDNTDTANEGANSEENNPIRLFITPIVSGNEVIAYLQIGHDLEEIQQALGNLRVLLLTAAPALVLLTALAGYWLAGRALSPIESIRAQAAAINANDLSQRLTLDLPDDEVGRLARTFNEMLARLEASFRRQRRFTADASHELRTPLAIIRGEVDVTLERPRASTEYVKALGSIGSETERMTRLINELLLLARSDVAELQLELESLDLSELLAILAEQMQNEAEAASVELSIDLPTPLPVRGDRDRLLQLFINLLENGFIYAPGSHMMIRGRVAGDAVEIAVTDTGPGIAPEHHPVLFERFYRVDKARNRASGGSGLGLAISQEIVHAHQGTIRVESTVGVGTTFIVRLPRGV